MLIVIVTSLLSLGKKKQRLHERGIKKLGSIWTNISVHVFDMIMKLKFAFGPKCQESLRNNYNPILIKLTE